MRTCIPGIASDWTSSSLSFATQYISRLFKHLHRITNNKIKTLFVKNNGCKRLRFSLGRLTNQTKRDEKADRQCLKKPEEEKQRELYAKKLQKRETRRDFLQ